MDFCIFWSYPLLRQLAMGSGETRIPVQGGQDQKTIIKKKNLKILINITNKIINNNNCHKKYIKI